MKNLNQSNPSKFRQKLNSFWDKHPKLLKALRIANKVLSVLLIAFCIFLVVLMGRACFSNSSKSTVVASADTLLESSQPQTIWTEHAAIIETFASVAYSSEVYTPFGGVPHIYSPSKFYLSFVYNRGDSLAYSYDTTRIYSLVDCLIPTSNALPFTKIGDIEYTGVSTLFTVSAPYFHTVSDQHLYPVEYYYGRESNTSTEGSTFDYFAIQGLRNNSFEYSYNLDSTSTYLASVSLPSCFQINNFVYYNSPSAQHYTSYNYIISLPCSRITSSTGVSVRGFITFFVCCTQTLYSPSYYYVFDPFDNTNSSASQYYSFNKPLTQSSPAYTYTQKFSTSSASIARPYSEVILHAYSTLYDLPYIQIVPSGLFSHYYDDGYAEGYKAGFDEPSKLNEFWALRWADEFLSYKWFGSFSFASFIAIAIAIAFAIMFLKFFAGG